MQVTRTRSSFALAALLLAAACIVAACGDSGDDAPSRAEFAQNADSICADVEKDINTLDKVNPETPAELANLIDQLKAKFNDGVDRLAALERPSGDDGKTAEEFVTALQSEFEEQAIPALDALEQAAKEQDRAKLRAAARKLDALEDTRSEDLARKLGAKKCAED
jgi:hypothetical protein